jgi:DNA-binding CsgD family transcriptional regulator
MLDTTFALSFANSGSAAIHALAHAGHHGPERRRAGPQMGRLLSAMLDEIDYGVVLVLDESVVGHVNHTARVELGRDHPLQLLGDELRPRRACDAAPLREALAAATQRGMRRMLTLGEPAKSVSVAVVPLSSAGHERQAALLVFGKREVCETLSVQSFARCHGLTPTETAVLQALCEGRKTTEIAQRHAVAMTTLRTQIGSIRQKTGAPSIRALVRQVAVLPPLVGALGRGYSNHGEPAAAC